MLITEGFRPDGAGCFRGGWCGSSDVRAAVPSDFRGDVFPHHPSAAAAAMKRRDELLKNIRRGDQVVTGGGVVGKVTKVIDDRELEVETRRRDQGSGWRGGISEVRVKGEPVKECFDLRLRRRCATASGRTSFCRVPAGTIAGHFEECDAATCPLENPARLARRCGGPCRSRCPLFGWTDQAVGPSRHAASSAAAPGLDLSGGAGLVLKLERSDIENDRLVAAVNAAGAALRAAKILDAGLVRVRAAACLFESRMPRAPRRRQARLLAAVAGTRLGARRRAARCGSI